MKLSQSQNTMSITLNIQSEIQIHLWQFTEQPDTRNYLTKQNIIKQYFHKLKLNDILYKTLQVLECIRPNMSVP